MESTDSMPCFLLIFSGSYWDIFLILSKILTFFVVCHMTK